MFVKLCGFEIKHQLKSITFYVFVLLTALFVFSQIGGFESWSKHPDSVKGLDKIKSQTYNVAGGPVDKDMETQKGVYEQLSRAVHEEKIIVARGFINKKEALSKKEIELIKESMMRISPSGKGIMQRSDMVLTMEEFEKVINDLDDALGGHTVFAKERRDGFIRIPKSYEELVAEEKRIVELGFTPLMAQLFADYYGIALAMLTVFLAAFVFYRDKRSRILELVCSRPVGGVAYVLSKFTGICISIFASIMVMAAVPTVFAVKMKMDGFDVNVLAYLTTFAVWLFPTVMFIVALAMLVTILSNNPIPAIAAQFLVFITSVSPLSGDYSLYKVFIRHNTMEPLADPQAFYTNRIFIVLMSVVLALITAWLWEIKRRRVGERIK